MKTPSVLVQFDQQENQARLQKRSRTLGGMPKFHSFLILTLWRWHLSTLQYPCLPSIQRWSASEHHMEAQGGSQLLLQRRSKLEKESSLCSRIAWEDTVMQR
jgi:hypothetical protein